MTGIQYCLWKGAGHHQFEAVSHVAYARSKRIVFGASSFCGAYKYDTSDNLHDEMNWLILMCNTIDISVVDTWYMSTFFGHRLKVTDLSARKSTQLCHTVPTIHDDQVFDWAAKWKFINLSSNTAINKIVITMRNLITKKVHQFNSEITFQVADRNVRPSF